MPFLNLHLLESFQLVYFIKVSFLAFKPAAAVSERPQDKMKTRHLSSVAVNSEFRGLRDGCWEGAS